MIKNRISAYCLQETCQLCNFMLRIGGYPVFHHGMMEKPQRQGQISAGVMIILNPALTKAWARTGKLTPLTSSPTSKFPGQMIGLTLSFPNKSNQTTDTYHQRAIGLIKILLCSVYHPYDFEEQKDFYNKLDHFIIDWPRNAEILMGADINCSVGITFHHFSNTLGPHRIDNGKEKAESYYIYIKLTFLFVGLFFFDCFDHWSIFLEVPWAQAGPTSQPQVQWRDSRMPHEVVSLSCKRGKHG